MRVATKEIRWHELRPLFSCDLQPCQPDRKGKQSHPYARDGSEQALSQSWKLATAGGDNQIRMWLITPLPHKEADSAASSPSPKVEYLATLSRHAGVVNAVRFSPDGRALASAGDDGILCIWALAEGEKPGATFGDESNEAQYAQEVWKARRTYRVTSAEIYDIAWSPDGQWILCGSTDNVARIYSAVDGSCHAQITDHNNYVQGVSWDPMNKYIATQSSDRHMHVYGLDIRKTSQGNELHFNLVGKNSKMDLLHKQMPSWTAESETEAEGPEASTSMRPPNEQFRMPDPKRSASRASDSSEASSFRHDFAAAAAAARNSSALDVEESPMDPPAPTRGRSPSRRSSISSAHASPIAGHARAARSPSPMPPLPAIRVPTPSSSTGTLHAKTPAATTNPDPKQKTSTHLYGDQETSPFFRRLAWSPDGSLLLTPAGLFDDPFAVTPTRNTDASNGSKRKKNPKAKGTLGPKPTVYIYSRANIGKPPVAHLPGHKSASIAIRFNPKLFELRRAASSTSAESKTVRLDIEVGSDIQMALDATGQVGKPLKGAFDLPYRMIYAIATHESVYIYDTQQAGPICIFGNLHYAPFTDVTWSADGQTLVLANQDGYCSIVAFEPDELGKALDERPAGVPSVPPSPVALTDRPPAAQSPVPAAPSVSQPLAQPSVAAEVSASRGDADEPKAKKRRIALTTQPLDT